MKFVIFQLRVSNLREEKKKLNLRVSNSKFKILFHEVEFENSKSRSLSQYHFLGIFKVFIIFQKKSCKTLSLMIIFSLSTNVIFSLLQICLKALALPFSKILDYLRHFCSLNSNNDFLLSFLIEIQINFFVLQVFT